MYIQALSHCVRNSDLMNYDQMKSMHEDSENVVQEFRKVSTFKLFTSLKTLMKYINILKITVIRINEDLNIRIKIC